MRVPGFVTIGTDPPTESDGNTLNFTVIPKAITFTIVLKEHRGVPLDQARLDAMRAESPGEVIVFHYLRLPEQQALLDQSVLFPGGVIASDGMPWADESGTTIVGDVWPLPEGAFAHPRSSANYTRLLQDYVRERAVLSLPEAGGFEG